jgi:hypothetical protein
MKLGRSSFDEEITHLELRGRKVFRNDGVIAQEILARMKYGVLACRCWQRIQSEVLTTKTESKANELKHGWDGTECRQSKCQTVRHTVENRHNWDEREGNEVWATKKRVRVML